MSKKKTKPKKASRRSKRAKYVALLIVILTASLSFGAVLGRWRNLPRAKSIFSVFGPIAFPAPSPSIPTPANPSKEYIYAGNRLVATEVPAPLNTALNAPTDLQVIVWCQAHLSWIDNSPNETSFKIEVSFDGGGTFSVYKTEPANTTQSLFLPRPGWKESAYVYRVRASNAAGDSGPSNTVSVPPLCHNCACPEGAPNFPPRVSMTAPAYGAAFTFGTPIQLNANASDSDGITLVQFYAGTSLIGSGTPTTPPAFSVAWTNAQVGAYDLTARATDAQGAVTTSAPVSVTITKSNQTITFGSLPNKTYGNAPFTVSATGGGSSNPVTFSASGNCTAGGANGSTITITGSGSCSVTASQAADSNYNAATNVSQPFTIGKATATIVVNGYTGAYDGNAHGATGSATGVNGENLNGLLALGASFTNVPGGTAAWTFDGNATNYSSASGSVTITIAKATPTITWNNPADIVYGTALSSTQLNATASLAGNSVAGTFAYSPPVGTILDAGNSVPLSTTFTPTDAVNFTTAMATAHINVLNLGNNFGFEFPVLPASGYQSGPSGGVWTFVGAGAGVTANNSAFTYGNPPTPEGNQAAFLQAGSPSSISQSIPGFQANLSYVVTFAAAQRGSGNNGGQDFQVYLDNTLLGTFRPMSHGYVDYSTAPFTTTAGAHTLKFAALDSSGGDNTAFLDNVRITQASGAPTQGLVAHWKFDENTGTTVADATGNGHQGTFLNGTGWATGKINAAGNFDGVDDMMSNNGIADLTNNFTLSFWALPTATHEIDSETTSGYGGTSGQRYAFWPTWYDTGQCGAGVSVGTNGVSVYEHAAGYMPATLVYPATITNWTHVTIVYENRQPKLYLNGILVRTGLTSPVGTVHLNPYSIGGQVYGYFAGRLDDVRVYNRPLSAAEVGALVNSSGGPVVNLALNKLATQSSTYAGAGGATANLAVDGNTDGNFFDYSVTHTNGEAQPWWQVDLGTVQSIQSVEIWNRTDCCGDRLTNFNVLLLDNNQAVVATANFPGQAGTPTTVQIAGTARYVKVQLVGTGVLSLAEVRVWGSVPFMGTPISIPGTIEAENYDNGVVDVAYHDTSAGTHGQDYDQPPNYPPPSYRQPTDVDIYKSAGGYSNGYLIVMQSGDWMKYSVNVTQSGSYTLYSRVAWGGGPGGTFHIEVDGVDKTGPIQIPDTGWSLALISKSGVQLTSGLHTMRLVADTNGTYGCTGDIDYLNFHLDSLADYSVVFDGTGRVNIPFSSSLNITGPITVEGWFKVNNNNTIQTIASNQSGVGGYLLVTNTGAPQFYYTSSPGVSDFAIAWPPFVTPGVWHHMAGVFDGNQIRVYLDGTLCVVKNTTIAPGPETSGLSIGNCPWYPFNGWIDEVRVSTGAVYTSNFTPEKHLTATANTRGLWKFDGQNLQDSSGNGNHGTFAGGAGFSTNVP